MKYAQIIFLTVLILSSLTVSGQDKDVRCRSSLKGGKYQWAGIDSILPDATAYTGFVLVRPKDVNREFMIKLARRIKEEYCKAQRLQITVFDDRRYANSNSLMDYARSKGQIVLMRGFYSFDRTNGKDLLEFSSKAGNPTTENMVNLDKE